MDKIQALKTRLAKDMAEQFDKSMFDAILGRKSWDQAMQELENSRKTATEALKEAEEDDNPLAP